MVEYFIKQNGSNKDTTFDWFPYKDRNWSERETKHIWINECLLDDRFACTINAAFFQALDQLWIVNIAQLTHIR